MKGGDISNRPAPRIVFVWENLLAQVAQGKEAQEARLVRRRKWAKALNLWIPSGQMRNVLFDLWFRLDANIDILCTHPEPFAKLLRRQLDERLPYGNLYNFSLMEFDKELAYLPNITHVFHAETDRPFLFGGRGQYLDPAGRGPLTV